MRIKGRGPRYARAVSEGHGIFRVLNYFFFLIISKTTRDVQRRMDCTDARVLRISDVSRAFSRYRNFVCFPTFVIISKSKTISAENLTFDFANSN